LFAAIRGSVMTSGATVARADIVRKSDGTPVVVDQVVFAPDQHTLVGSDTLNKSDLSDLSSHL